MDKQMRADETLFYFAGLAGRIDADLVLRRARALLHEFRSLPRIPCTLARICASSPTSTSTPTPPPTLVATSSCASSSSPASSRSRAVAAAAVGSEGCSGPGSGSTLVEPALDALSQAPTLWDTPYNPTVFCVGHTPPPAPAPAPSAEPGPAPAAIGTANNSPCPFSARDPLST